VARLAAPPARPPTTCDQVALVASLARGDEAAFAAYYAAWFQPTLALARAACRRDEAFCLDVVQDVMMNVAKKMPALSSDASIGAWMARSVLHAATDRLRSESRRRRREEHAGSARAAAGEPWHDLADAERRQWLFARLQELPAEDRALLAARFGEATTVTAAGALLGMGPDAAHGRLRRVLERLRQRAAEWWHG
jgi:RNA polymerase sigma factor (sigma-70 family)